MQRAHAPAFARSTTLAAAACTALTLSAIVPAAAQAGGAQTMTIPVHAHSARAAFKEAAGAMRGLANVRVRSAVADKADRFVEGAFTATYRGTPVTGLLLAGTGGSAVAVLDTPDRAPQTVPATLAMLSSQRGGGSGAARPLHRVSFGTGSVSLPDSWSVLNSYQGCVEAGSQQDHAYLAFGCSQAALAPPLLPGTDPRQVLVLTSYDPVAALARVITSPPPVGIGASGFRVREVKPVQATANGRAAYVLFDYAVQGAPYRGLALVNLAAVDTRTLLFYKSMFMTPASTFPQLAPTLWKSWQSWGVNGNVLTSRLFAAAQSMRETGDIITGAYWDRQHVQDQVNLGFDQYIRDAAQMEDTSTGRRWNGSWDDLQHVVDANPNRFRIVPLSELQP